MIKKGYISVIFWLIASNLTYDKPEVRRWTPLKIFANICTHITITPRIFPSLSLPSLFHPSVTLQRLQLIRTRSWVNKPFYHADERILFRHRRYFSKAFLSRRQILFAIDRYCLSENFSKYLQKRSLVCRYYVSANLKEIWSEAINRSLLKIYRSMIYRWNNGSESSKQDCQPTVI